MVPNMFPTIWKGQCDVAIFWKKKCHLYAAMFVRKKNWLSEHFVKPFCSTQSKTVTHIVTHDSYSGSFIILYKIEWHYYHQWLTYNYRSSMYLSGKNQCLRCAFKRLCQREIPSCEMQVYMCVCMCVCKISKNSRTYLSQLKVYMYIYI